MSQSSPQPFGEYHLLEKIATGGMAEVWRARAYGMAGFEKILVIKKVLDHLAEDQEFIDLFIDEARIAVQLLHVNIVQVFDLGHVDGSYYMAMEYVHGLDLARLVSRSKDLGPFPIPLALFVAGEVLKALQFAHERRGESGEPLHIVHCDISPQNVLISYAGEVKITDFGISRAAFQATSAHDVVRGKYAYMSPEQVEGQPLSGKSDLFSLGIVLYELLTGRRLFKARTRDETLARVRRAEVPSPRAYRPELSEDLEAILLRALAARPEDRYPDAGAMLDDLSVLMVREGHRATNNDLAAFVKDVIEHAGKRKTPPKTPKAPTAASCVVLAAEAFPPPRSLARPHATPQGLRRDWEELIGRSGADVWERSDHGVLAVWIADGDLGDTVPRALTATLEIRRLTHQAGYRIACGVAPGVVRLDAAGTPDGGWELAGPFYLARWMMNLSAHRGRVLLTEVGARHLRDKRTELLGRIGIEGNKYINLYEVA